MRRDIIGIQELMDGWLWLAWSLKWRCQIIIRSQLLNRELGYTSHHSGFNRSSWKVYNVLYC